MAGICWQGAKLVNPTLRYTACTFEAHVAISMQQVSSEITGSRSSPHFKDVTNVSLSCCTSLSEVITCQGSWKMYGHILPLIKNKIEMKVE